MGQQTQANNAAKSVVLTISGSIDPSAVAVDAIKGTLYIRKDTPKIYQKQDDGLTVNWVENSSAPAVALTSINDQLASSTRQGNIAANVASAAGSMASGGTVVPNTASGVDSHAEGVGSIANQQAAHAEGSGTSATGAGAHSEGDGTTASGFASHSEGHNNTQATNTGAHAEGNGTTASGPASHSEGINTLASGDNSHAEGNGTTASGNHSHAEGQFSTASGLRAHAEGVSTASGENSHAEGQSTAQGINAHSEGVGTLASATASHAEGDNTTASGTHSHAEGINTTASAAHSHAEGSGTQALQPGAHAEGDGCIVNAANAHAEGFSSVVGAAALHSNAKGKASSTKDPAQMAHASGGIGFGGDNQYSRHVLNQSVNDIGGAGELFIDSQGPANRITIGDGVNNAVYMIHVMGSALQTNGAGVGDSAGFDFKYLVKRIGAGVPVIVGGGGAKAPAFNDAGAAGWTLTPGVVGNDLSLTVVNTVSQIVHWNAVVRISEVQG